MQVPAAEDDGEAGRRGCLQSLGVRVRSLGFRVRSLGFRIHTLRVQNSDVEG